MVLIELIEQERILNYEVGLKHEALKSFLLFFEKKKPKVIGQIDHEYVQVFIQDTWSLLELRQNYKASLMERSVSFREIRQFIVATMAQHEQIIKNAAFFSASPIKNFIFSSIFVNKMVQWLNDHVDFSDFNRLEFTEEFANCNQPDDRFFHEWNHFLDKMIFHSIHQITVAEKLFGNAFWTQLNPSEIGELLLRLEGNQFSEVLFSKENIKANHLVPVRTKTTHHSNSTVVFCVQQDESMQALNHLQLGLTLKLIEISKQANHDFIYFPFANTIEQETVVLKGKLDAKKYFKISKGFIGEKEDIRYKKAINFAFTLLKLELSSASGEIYLLCNERLFDYLPIEDYWKNAVLKFKSEKDIEITVLYIGDATLLTNIWFADRVVLLENLVALQ